jgi:hypothetical protein
MPEIVYFLTNEAMEGMVKIGRTTTSVEQRIRELDNTSMPLPFQCFYAAEVGDSSCLLAAGSELTGSFFSRWHMILGLISM